jgi:hypothetical protein
LPQREAARFYRIWWALLRYTNAQRRLIADPPAWPPAATLAASDADKLRQAVWADDSLREAFIAANPEALPAADLDVVASWKHRIAGTFFVLRHLEKYAVFLAEGSPARAYGVVGLLSSFEEVVGPHLPIAVRAVLLPFEGKIIYDGLLTAYNVTIGSTIRRSLGVASRNAQEREGIITSLLPSISPSTMDEERSAIRSRNAKILAAFRTALSKSGLSTTESRIIE